MLARTLPVNESGSFPYLPADDDRVVEALAEQRLRSARLAEFRRVTCLFADGVLTLCGVVGSYYLKQLAQTTVRNIEEVAHVENLIRVGAIAAK
jgi:osmotically-inducible protein OsmY